MKKILITGANSYIGINVENYLKTFDGYEITTLDMIGESWKETSFKGYDVIFHVAGIAHNDNGEKTSIEKEALYYRVNRDLAIECAKKAKGEGVKQFIFMSSAIVYGKPSRIGDDRLVTQYTETNPANAYGNSKLMAEQGILPLNDSNFKVVILRPPMIFGQGCKGNFPTLVKIAKYTFFFPNANNKRSLLYVGNLVHFIKLMIDNNESGIFHPANSEAVNTAHLVLFIRKANGKKTVLVRWMTKILRFLSHFTPLVNKAFGSFRYDAKLTEYKEEYRLYSLEEAIKEAVKK